ncbi:MAG: hypothetical protein ACKPKO_53865, partial [Candidatus Fonsibacter sp.]
METNNETVVPEHYNPNQLVTYKVIEYGITSYPTGKVVDIEWCLEQMRHNTKVSAELRLQISQLENNLSEYMEMDAEDIVSSICDIFSFNPTKEIEFEATATITGTVTVALKDMADFDIDSIDLF